MRLIDSHAHLTGDELYPDVDSILQRAFDAGVESIINICTDVKTLERGVELRKRYPQVYNAASTTPHDAVTEGDLYFSTMEAAARRGDLVAVGETGLEYFHFPETKEVQKTLFVRYLQLAIETSLPVIIHCRDAFEDFFKIIDDVYPNRPGVLHCFTGTEQEAQQLMERGWYLSLSGIVTFKKSEELRRVAKNIPLDRLLVETDSPYLAPQSRRGKQNEPAYIFETARCVADVRGISVETLVEATNSNTKSLFFLR